VNDDVVLAAAAVAAASARGATAQVQVPSNVEGQVTSLWEGGSGCSWIYKDNCQNTDEFACRCRELNPNGPCTPCPNSKPREAAVPDAVQTTVAAAAQLPAAAPTTQQPAATIAVPAAAESTATAGACSADQTFQFPSPTISASRGPLTTEQTWMKENWPGYHNGVSLGGAYVIEDWMFYRHPGAQTNDATLQLAQGTTFDNLRWSEEMLKGDLETAYATLECHITKFYDDAALDELADFGINSVRLVVGYWIFDDPTLYPGDTWIHAPSGSGPHGNYGVNPDGFFTSGTGPLTDLVIKLWNRNINVLLDMHALPGCSSPHQSYAGVHCEPHAPNTWNGQAHDGISGGHKVRRADDGKTWTDVAKKIALERVVPWIKFVNKMAPGAIMGYELVNEPDIASSDATLQEVRALTVDLGKDVLACLGEELKDEVFIGIGTASKNVPSTKVAQDYTTSYSEYKDSYVSDIHHYFYWAGCVDYGAKTFSVQCACEANLPGTAQENEDADWSNWMKSGVFEQGWRFYIGEWSAGLGTAHKCQGGVPTTSQATSLWQAQKWGYLNQYMHYGGKASNQQSAFFGDYYWNGRMGYNWNPSPSVCAGPSSTEHYTDFKSWDWSLLRLIKLGIAKPLSKMGWTPATIASKKASTCTGTIPVLCEQTQAPQAPPGGQPGMAPPGGQPGMRLDEEFGHPLSVEMAPDGGDNPRLAIAGAAAAICAAAIVASLLAARAMGVGHWQSAGAGASDEAERQLLAATSGSAAAEHQEANKEAFEA